MARRQQAELTKGVSIDLGKGAQCEADAVLGAGEADVAQERGKDQVLVGGIHAETETVVSQRQAAASLTSTKRKGSSSHHSLHPLASGGAGLRFLHLPKVWSRT